MEAKVFCFFFVKKKALLPMSISKNAVWFITGCSTGFGRELAKIILNQGGQAVVTARDAARVQDLADAYPQHALALSLDVTKSAEIARAVADAEAKFGRIDVLVNNAGYGFMAAIEEATDAEIRDQFEANVFGLIAMTQAVLPGMRARGHGHIVNLSSQGGLVGFPGVGIYNASKFAVEGLSEALAAEIRPLGLGVTIVEPGPFRTDWAGRSLKLPTREIPAYAETAGARRRQISGYSGTQKGDPVRAAQAIVTAVESEKPPLHLLLGKTALDLVRGKLRGMLAEFDAWETTTLGADFPDS
jgi:NAD(P)-dependent dehydrogenase (short-subunit alcohol dehydrogenase family)